MSGIESIGGPGAGALDAVGLHAQDALSSLPGAEAPAGPPPSASPSAEAAASAAQIHAGDIAAQTIAGRVGAEIPVQEGIAKLPPEPKKPEWQDEQTAGEYTRDLMAVMKPYIEKVAVAKEADRIVANGDRLLAEGKYPEARAEFEKLKQPPHSEVKVDLLNDRLPPSKGMGGGGTGARADAYDTGGNETTIKATKHGDQKSHTEFETTAGETADVRLAQIDQLERMAKVVPPPVNPHDLGQMRVYFDKYARGEDRTPPEPRTTDEVRTELQTYLSNHYAPVGDVKWAGAADDRTRDFTRLLGDQPTDGAGRKLVDCQGYTSLSEQILGGITGPDGKTPRFEFRYAGHADHEVLGVFERGKKDGGDAFVVNNHETIEIPPEARFKPGEDFSLVMTRAARFVPELVPEGWDKEKVPVSAGRTPSFKR